MKEKITIYNPGLKNGGTVDLFATLTKQLIQMDRYDIEIIDYPEGVTVKLLNEANLKYKLIEFSEEIKINYDTNFIINTLSGKLLGNKIYLTDNSKVNLFTTFIYDLYKYLNSHSLFYKCNIKLKSRALHVLHPIKIQILKDFINATHKKNGIVFMDPATKRSAEFLVKRNLEDCIVPIFTQEVSNPDVWNRTNCNTESIHIFWVGRLEDFKYCTVCSLALSISETANVNSIVLHVVGDGTERKKTEAYLNRLKVNVVFYGHLDSNNLNELLIKKADVCFGHGLSIVKCASLGIPSIVIDGIYQIVKPDDFKGDWLFNQKNFSVGKISNSPEELEGIPIKSIIENLKIQDLPKLGKDSYDYWFNYHSAASVAEKYVKFIFSNQFTYSALINSGVTLNSKAINFIKEFIKPYFYKALRIKVKGT